MKEDKLNKTKHESFKRDYRGVTILGMSCPSVALLQNFVMIWVVSKMVFNN